MAERPDRCEVDLGVSVVERRPNVGQRGDRPQLPQSVDRSPTNPGYQVAQEWSKQFGVVELSHSAQRQRCGPPDGPGRVDQFRPRHTSRPRGAHFRESIESAHPYPTRRVVRRPRKDLAAFRRSDPAQSNEQRGTFPRFGAFEERDERRDPLLIPAQSDHNRCGDTDPPDRVAEKATDLLCDVGVVGPLEGEDCLAADSIGFVVQRLFEGRYRPLVADAAQGEGTGIPNEGARVLDESFGKEECRPAVGK